MHAFSTNIVLDFRWHYVLWYHHFFQRISCLSFYFCSYSLLFFFPFPVILIHVPVMIEVQAKCVNLTWKLFRFILEMMMPLWKAFRKMPVLSKFGKMTWRSEIQKYKLVTKLLNYKKKSFPVWRHFVTSRFYLKYLNKQSNLYTCTTQEMKWFLLNITDLVERIKFGLSIKTCLIVNILFNFNPFIWVLFTLSINFV